MREELEQLFLKHGSYWVVALVGVALSKLYSKEIHTLKTILRSVLASLVFTYVFVEVYSGKMDKSTVLVYVIAISFLVDVIAEMVMAFGLRIKEDPSLLTKFLPWSKK